MATNVQMTPKPAGKPVGPQDIGVAIEADKMQSGLDLVQERFLAEADPERGLDEDEVARRQQQYGPNELQEDEMNPILKFLSYFWGPMPIMIWIAILVELIKGSITGSGWEDFGILFALQLINGTVGYFEERNAGNAIKALKEKLKPDCYVIRHAPDGTLHKGKIKATELVPGDVIDLKAGDVIPADCALLGDPDDLRCQLQVDESALTGESLPVTVRAHDRLKMSAAVKQGEQRAVVVAIGKDTFYGKAAALLNIGATQGRFQKVLFKVTLSLLFISLVLCGAIFTVMITVKGSSHSSKQTPFLRAISTVIVILVASIPIAMQVVSTSTMAMGSHELSREKVIVARLGAIEELAGMTVLCSDKTGTLTKNKLTLGEPRIFEGLSAEELNFYAALATARNSENIDAIDECIINSLPSERTPDTRTEWTRERLAGYETIEWEPFNPVSKRAEATIRTPEGRVFKVSKGAPQKILALALENPEVDPALREHVEAIVQDLADRGYRALGVALSETGPNEVTRWVYHAVLSLYDPPRDDTKETIKQAIANGVEVKMITGDQKAIAVETCRRLNMGTEIFTADLLDDPSKSKEVLNEQIYTANGFAEVMPEHKFNIVQSLRERGLVVGMTGDGVNDAPALKRADIGIAVEGATDAARAAADIVLTEPGLSVIIKAIMESRKIFQRMRNYAIYRISGTIQLLFFFFIAVVAVYPSTTTFYGGSRPAVQECQDGSAGKDNDPWAHAGTFTIPVSALVLITVLNDICIISISRDRVVPADVPQGWDLRQVGVISTVLGLTACLSSVILLVYTLQANCTNPGTFFGNILGSRDRAFVTYGEAQTILYLKISISDFLTVFAARTRKFFWERPPGVWLGSAAFVALGLSTIFAAFWPFHEKGLTFDMKPLKNVPYSLLAVWIYCFIWFIVQDAFKVLTYKLWYFIDEEQERMKTVAQRATVSKLRHKEEKQARDRRRRRAMRGESFSGSLERAGSFILRGESMGSLGSVEPSTPAAGSQLLRTRVDQLEREVRELRDLLRQALGEGALGQLRMRSGSQPRGAVEGGPDSDSEGDTGAGAMPPRASPRS